MTGVIYARYSSDNQREESIEGQLRECQAYAERSGIDIVGTYIDRAFSAKTDKRPDFQRMIKDSAKKTFETVIVWKLDRFARNRYDSAHYKSMLKKNGVRVISATETISPGSEGILLESVLEGMAEYYSADLAEKVIRGHTENALKCKYNGGTLPIGFTTDKEQNYLIDPITAPLVVQSFQNYVNGMGMKQIADELNLLGVKNHRGGKIKIDNVNSMLKNRKYLGEYSYRDIVVPDGIPRIVSNELFEQVQQRMAKNKKAPSRHKAEDDYILTTKLFCGKCGSMMAGESGTSATTKIYHYYKCNNAKRHLGCDKKAVGKKWIEDIVIGEILLLLKDDTTLGKIADAVVAETKKENPAILAMNVELADTQLKLKNIMNAIENGIFTESTKSRLDELEKLKKKLTISLQAEQAKHPVLSKEQIIAWFHRLRTFDVTKKEHRERLIDTFINAIFLFDDKLVITFNYQNGSKTILLSDLEKSSCLNEFGRPYRVFITKVMNTRYFFAYNFLFGADFLLFFFCYAVVGK